MTAVNKASLDELCQMVIDGASPTIVTDWAVRHFTSDEDITAWLLEVADVTARMLRRRWGTAPGTGFAKFEIDARMGWAETSAVRITTASVNQDEDARLGLARSIVEAGEDAVAEVFGIQLGGLRPLLLEQAAR